MHPRTWDGVQCVGRSHGSFPASTALQLRASRNKTISIIFVMKGKKQVCSPKSLLENTKIRERSETMVKSFEIHSSFWCHKNTFWYTFSKCILSLKEKFTVLIMCILSSKKQFTEKSEKENYYWPWYMWLTLKDEGWVDGLILTTVDETPHHTHFHTIH